MDFHKWGYAAKGASVILYKDRAIRRYQIFSYANWTGYAVINPGVTSTKGGGPIAACWAILNYLGRDGYLKLVGAAQAASRKIVEAVAALADARGVSRAQVALAWLRSRTAVAAPIIGATKLAHLDDAIAACVDGEIEDCKTELTLRRLRDLLGE